MTILIWITPAALVLVIAGLLYIWRTAPREIPPPRAATGRTTRLCAHEGRPYCIKCGLERE